MVSPTRELLVRQADDASVNPMTDSYDQALFQRLSAELFRASRREEMDQRQLFFYVDQSEAQKKEIERLGNIAEDNSQYWYDKYVEQKKIVDSVTTYVDKQLAALLSTTNAPTGKPGKVRFHGVVGHGVV